MIPHFIDPRDEGPALRRAAMLLEHVREDAPALDPRLEELVAGIGTLQRAAAAGRTVHISALARLRAVLADATPVVAPPAGGRAEELVRWNTFAELRELFRRLAFTRLARVAQLTHEAGLGM